MTKMQSICCLATALGLGVCGHVLAQETLKGQITVRTGAAARLPRPGSRVQMSPGLVQPDALPNKLPNKLIDVTDFASGLTMDGSITGQSAAVVQTDTSYKNDALQSVRAGFGQQSISEQDGAPALVCWEDWHHRFAANVGKRWEAAHSQARGTAKLLITITRDQAISVVVEECHAQWGDAEIDNSSSAEEYFLKALLPAIKSLDGSSILKFPLGSTRQKVLESATMTRSDGPDLNFEWGNGDVERVAK